MGALKKSNTNLDEREEAFKRSVARVEVYNTPAELITGITSDGGSTLISGMVINLSSKGCCIVVRSDFIPIINSFCRVTIGKQMGIISQVRWTKSLEDGLYKVGIAYQL